MSEEAAHVPETQKVRGVTMSAAAFALICFFLPWVQVSCLGVKDSASGLDLARGGSRALWLLPLLMIAILLFGSIRIIWEQMSALFALAGMVGGSLSVWLMLRERSNASNTSGLIATFWTAWFWLGIASSLIVTTAALWFYSKRVRGP